MAIDEGITTLESLSGKKPSQSLRPEPNRPPRKIEERFGNVTDYRLMWTGSWMRAVVSDDDAHLCSSCKAKKCDETCPREMMLIPRIVKAPFEPHINENGDLKRYFDKGFVLFEDAPPEVKAAYKKGAERKLTGGTLTTPLTPEAFEKEQAQKKSEEKVVEKETTSPRNNTGQFTKKSNS